eukprot:jgi/Chlat1/3495/Chrsp23S00265
MRRSRSGTGSGVFVANGDAASGSGGQATDVDPARAFIRTARRVIVKVGTAVVTRSNDGRLALGKLGALVEQLEGMITEGREVIVVTSGAVGAGRQRLRHLSIMNSSLADLKRGGMHVGGDVADSLDTKACAAVGQSGLMALYDALFAQMDLTTAQLLLTEAEFSDSEFKAQLRTTVDELLRLGVVPVINENDAVSTRKAPYKDATGIFWDNDSLAALLAIELRADVLVLLSDVEGLYTGPPDAPNSRLVHTYDPALTDGNNTAAGISFGPKSRVGRGGMTAKVEAAWKAAAAGTPVVIASGVSSTALARVMRGEHVGTLFCKDAATKQAADDQAARTMAALSSEERAAALHKMADALLANEARILAENAKDVKAAEAAHVAPPLLNRLRLKPGKLAQLATGIRAIADQEEPMGKLVGSRVELAEGLVLEQRTAPLGVLLVIFESRPDALPQIAALAVRSGNGLLLKGGKEAMLSNRVLHDVVAGALPESVGRELIGLVTSREGVDDLLKLGDGIIDLVIPRGSNALVQHIQRGTRIPVLGHADGVCHVYVDAAADTAMAEKILLDSKLDYPSACNAAETVLVHESLLNDGRWAALSYALVKSGVTLYGGPRAEKELSLPAAPALHHEYGAAAMTVEVVGNVREAVEYVHANGSGHTESVITEDHDVAEEFLRSVDSACVHHNASTRFSDGFRYGLGAEVGISTSRIHARGPVGVKGLLTTRWLLRGAGHVVDKDKDINYTHRTLPVE